MVGDSFRDRWAPHFPEWPGGGSPTQPLGPMKPIPGGLLPSPPTRAEFDQLKREVEMLKDLLQRAKAYDEANNEPSCETEEKVALLKAVAKMVGVDLEDVLGK
jgi:hypothetical protein